MSTWGPDGTQVDDPVGMHQNDIIRACVKLVGDAGAREMEIGAMREGVPIEDARWFATASYRGLRIIKEDRRSPIEAAIALALEILAGAQCKCTKMVVMYDNPEGCHWRLMGDEWVSSCDAPPMVDVPRGDLVGMHEVMNDRQARDRDNR